MIVRRAPRQRPPASRAAATLRWSCAQAALLGMLGCTIVQPVPDMATTGRLSTLPTGRPATAAGAPAGCDFKSSFAGGLEQAICDVDNRRLAYLQLSADVLNTNAAYNAMLWPLGGAMLYELLRGAPNQNLLLPSVLAAVAFGFMSSGVPERQQIYLKASRQLACAIIESSADLYPLADVRSEQFDASRQMPVPLEAALRALRDRIGDYETRRSQILADAESRPGATAQRSDSYTDASRQLRGGAGGSKGADSRPQLTAETRARLDRARALLATGRAMLRQVSGGAATLLRAEAARVDALLQQQMAEKAKAPADPAAVMSQLVSIQRSLLTLQAASEEVGKVDPDEAALPREALDGLSLKTLKEVREFQSKQAVELHKASRDVAEWISRHKATQDQLRTTLAQSGCSAEPAAAPPLAPAASRGVARPGTSNTLPAQSTLSP